MEIGIYALPTYFAQHHGGISDFYAMTVDLFAEAEERRFASGWVNEHHFHPYGGMIPAPAVLLGAIAARTHRIRLGTSVALLPLHDPIEVAEAYAMVDQLSSGRLEFGVGRGFVAHDYETMGVPFAEGQERLVEAVEVITGLWREREYPGHHGRFFEVPPTVLWPPPLQVPHPPIWAAASRNPGSFSAWGRAGVNLLTALYLHSLEENARLIALWREGATEAGVAERLRVGTHVMVLCDEDREVAEASGLAGFLAYSRQHASARSGAVDAGDESEFRQLVEEGRLIVSDPPGCIAMLREIERVVGVDSVDCGFFWGDLPHELARRSFELFADEVLPAIVDREGVDV